MDIILFGWDRDEINDGLDFISALLDSEIATSVTSVSMNDLPPGCDECGCGDFVVDGLCKWCRLERT